MSPDPTQPGLLAIRAQFPRFAAPLLFVHGLWTESSLWHASMSLLAQRGWDCFALCLPRRGAPSWARWRATLRSALHECGSPPVIIGHGSGVLLGLELDADARALVGLTPFLPDAFRAPAPRLSSTCSLQLAAWRGRLLPPPRVLAHVLPPPGGWCDAPAQLVRAAAGWSVPPALRPLPRILVASDADMLCPVAQVRTLATACSAETLVLAAAGPTLAWGRGWDHHLALVHRWLVQRLGAELLLESDAQEEVP